MRGIEKLHPAIRAKAERLLALCKEAGLPVLITETLRTREEQDALYAKGRSATGSIVTNAQYPYSMHCWGVAFDVAKNIKGKEYDNSDSFFERVGEIGRGMGLTWGGDWAALKDMPHFEDRSVAGAVNELIKQFRAPDKFIGSWGQHGNP